MLDGRAPDVQHLGHGSVLVLVNPHFIHVALLLSAAHGSHKRGRIEDFGLHVQDGALAVRRPVRVLAGFGAYFIPLVQALVGPDVDYLVQRANFGVEKGGELRVFFPVRQSLFKGLLENGHTAGLEVVSPDFVNHLPVPPGLS